jgi:large subunit ribosomal protein L13Ae
MTGSFVRNKLKYMQFKNKRCNYQPKNGPFHQRSPSKILYRTIRGMIPHKTARGTAAMARLKVFEGVPPPYDTLKRVVVPDALRQINLQATRKYTVLGRLSSEVGWKHADVVSKLETKRKVRASQWYARQKAVQRVKAKAVENTAQQLEEVNSQLTALGGLH